MTASGGGSGPRRIWKEDPLRPSRGGGSGLGLADLLGRDVRTLTGAYRRVKALVEGVKKPGGGDGGRLLSPGDGGPDRVSEMPGGAEVLLRRRRARRRELVKEALNVGAGVVGVFLVSGLALLGWGLELGTAAGAGAAAALGYGYVLGREVLADLVGVRDRERRDAGWD